MPAFTIHSFDEALDRKFSERAREEGVSKNRLIKTLLAKALGLPTESDYTDDYREFVGIWSPEEKDAFDSRQSDNATVDDAE